jgi:hypothetical protein
MPPVSSATKRKMRSGLGGGRAELDETAVGLLRRLGADNLDDVANAA